MQNILRHGFECGQIQGHVLVLFQTVPDRLNITFMDDAPPSFPHLWPVGDRPAEQGGLGLKLISALTTTASFQPTRNGNIAILVFTPETENSSGGEGH